MSVTVAPDRRLASRLRPKTRSLLRAALAVLSAIVHFSSAPAALAQLSLGEPIARRPVAAPLLVTTRSMPISTVLNYAWCPPTPTALFIDEIHARRFHASFDEGKTTTKNDQVVLEHFPRGGGPEWENLRLEFEMAARSAPGFRGYFDDNDVFTPHGNNDPLHAQENAKNWKAMGACSPSDPKCYRGGLSGSRPRTVAILDDGVDNHIDLPGGIVRYELEEDYSSGRDCVADGCCPATMQFLANTHATQVAGIIAALENNGEGIAGLGVVEKIVSIRVYESQGGCLRREYVVRGVQCATQLGAEVINMSFGSEDDPKEPVEIRQALTDAENTPLAVASAGNGGAELGSAGYRIWPANFQLDNLITAEGRELNGDMDSSNFNDKRVHLAAPVARNDDVQSTDVANCCGYSPCPECGKSYSGFSESSAAAAMISAAATLVWSHPNYKDCTPQQLRHVLVGKGKLTPGPHSKDKVCMVQLGFLENKVEVDKKTGATIDRCLNLPPPSGCGQP